MDKDMDAQQSLDIVISHAYHSLRSAERWEQIAGSESANKPGLKRP